MIKSMTGYGRANEVVDGRDITVEIKSVNHRFFEFSIRSPRAFGYLDDKMKRYVQGSISRGKVDVFVSIATTQGVCADVQVNHELAGAYVKALRELGESLSVTDDLSLSSLMRLQDIFSVKKNPDDEEEVWQGVKHVADQALSGFIAMRETEGNKLREDIETRLDMIADAVGKVEVRSPLSQKEYLKKLEERMKEVLADTSIDEQRILTEAALYADKTDVSEETTRLRSHISQLRELLIAQSGPVGRKLDFLVQELNREANTIGSKGQDIELARIVVDIKSEIEKIREQIQNIE